MELARLTSKGQLTIPAAIRKKLGLDFGDRLLFYEKNGQIIMAPESPAALRDAQIAAAENYVYSIEEIRKIAIPIAQKYKAASLTLFGSYARGEATCGSDIDLIISCGEVRSLLQLGGMQDELSEAFHKQVDLLTEDSLEPEFRKSVEADRVVLYDSHA